MSLGKLLATGRSLVGGAPDEGRYNISSRNQLPKFGSAKNPFARPAPPAQPVPVELPVEQVVPTVVPTPTESEPVAPVSVAGHKKTQVIEYKKTQRIRELSEQPFGAVGQVSQFSMKEEPFTSRMMAVLSMAVATVVDWVKMIFRKVRNLKWGPLAAGLWAQICRTGPWGRAAWTKVQSTYGKMTGLFRKQEPKSVIPRFGKPAVQTELSLDRVKVVRNSLEDSDLEVVTADTATSTQVAPKTPVASSKRGPVPPALKKMTERLLGMQALD